MMAQNQTNKIAFLNGIVLTIDSKDNIFDSVYVENGKIRAVGTTDKIKANIPGDTTIINIKGKTLIPGFIDAHNHMCLQGAALGTIRFNFPEVASITDLVKNVAQAAETTKDGHWIRGWGMDYEKYPEKRLPTRWDMDAVSKNHPVCIVHYTGHFVLVNSLALKQAGVDDHTADPSGGKFVRDKKGRVTGMALDAAQQLVVPTSVKVGHHGPDIGYDAPLQEIVDDIHRACMAYQKVGITSVVDPQVTTREMPAYIEARRQGKLGIKTTCMYLSNHMKAINELGITGAIGDDWLSIGPVKYYCDGALVGGTAAFYMPLHNRPDTYGTTYWKAEELIDSLVQTHRSGLQFGIHAQGDKGIDIVLQAVQKALKQYPRRDHRHRIEHYGGPTPEQIELASQLGIIPITQPGQLYEAGDDLIANYGIARARRLYPLRSILDAGIPAVVSTDAFVQSYKPLDAISGAVNRKSWKGDDMGAEERISVLEAIRAYTLSAANSVFQEDQKGSIEVGKVADLTLIGGKILDTPKDEISKLSIDMTVIDGQIVHQQ
jgi:predicted amidohydrolase YtcJ